MTPYKLLASADAVYLDASALPKIDIEEDGSSKIIRIVVYMSNIPVFASQVGFGEFVSVVGKKRVQKKIGASGFLYACRALMVDGKMSKINFTEPTEDRFAFMQLADRLLPKYAKLGGGDVWHLMSLIELLKKYPRAVLLSLDKKLVAAASKENLHAVYAPTIDSEQLRSELVAAKRWVVG